MKIKIPKKGFKKLTKEKARIIAHLIGDGTVFRSKHDYNIKYEVCDKESLISFENDLKNVYGLQVTHGENPSGKTGKLIPFVRLRSKIVSEDLMRYATYFSKDWNLKPLLLNSPKVIRKEFLKALFDDEGSVIPYGKNKLIRLYSINLEGLKQIQKILSNFKMQSKLVSGFGLKRNVYALTIKDIKLFHKQVGFNLERKQEKIR